MSSEISPLGNNYKGKIQPFNSTKQDDFQIWELRWNAALQSRKLSEAMTEDGFEKNVNEKALGILISALGNNSLQALEQRKTANDSGGKLERRYAGKTVMNRLESLRTVFNMKCEGRTLLEDHLF